MKKILWTLNVNGYAPEITALTYPLLERYAEKCGAEFRIITERKFPEWPVTYEKMQIHQLAQEHGADWSLYVDSDAIVHPDMFDVTNHLPLDTVAHNGKDMASIRWKFDQYFKRDGRFAGSCNWFTVASSWCLDLWRPLDDLTPEQVIANIYPRMNELAPFVRRCINRQCGYEVSTHEAAGQLGTCTKCGHITQKMPKPVIPAEHLADDYALSRNIARFGLKLTTVEEIKQERKEIAIYLWHMYTLTLEEKLQQIKEVLRAWGIDHLVGLKSYDVSRALAIPGWMTEAELRWLAEQADSHDSIVEMGSCYGRSTRALADYCSGELIAVDDWKGPRDVDIPAPEREQIYDKFNRNLSDTKAELRTVKANFNDLGMWKSKNLPKSVSMVFLDGDHEFLSVRRDLKFAISLLKPGGLLCGHDYDQPGVRRAVEELVGEVKTVAGTTLWYTRTAKAEEKTA
jgi:predicted O-methyltransferase YrrM